MTLETKLYKLRRKFDYNQEYVAKYMGVTRQAYSNYELGKREPDIELLKKLSELYGVSIDSLLENEIREENAVYNHEQLKKKIVKDLGDDVEIHFFDAKKITDEQLEIIKAIVNMEWNKEKK